MSDNQESREELAEDEIDQLLAGAAEEPSSDDGDDLLADFEDALGGAADAPSSAAEEDDGDLSDLDAFLDEFEQSLDGEEEMTPEEPTPALDAAPEPEEALDLPEAEDEPLDDRLPDDDLLDLGEEEAAEGVPDAADIDSVVAAEPEAVAAEEELEAPELDLDEADLDEVAEAASPGQAAEPEATVAQGADDGLEELDHDFDSLDEDDLNLADDDEPLPEEPEPGATGAAAAAGVAAAAGAATRRGGNDDLFADTVEDMAPPEPERRAPPPPPPAAATPPDRRPLMAAIAALVLAIASGAGVGWMTMGVKSDLAQLTEAVEAMKGRTVGGEADPSRVDQLSREVGQLNQRLSELALLMEGPMSHVRDSNRRELESIFSRLDATEKRLAGVDDSLSELKRAPPVRTAATAPRATASKPATKAAPAPADAGAWAVNLVSLSSRNTAERELSILREAGIKAELQQVTISGKRWYRLRVTGFESKEAAGRYAQQIRGKTRIEIDPWLDRI